MFTTVESKVAWLDLNNCSTDSRRLTSGEMLMAMLSLISLAISVSDIASSVGRAGFVGVLVGVFGLLFRFRWRLSLELERESF